MESARIADDPPYDVKFGDGLGLADGTPAGYCLVGAWIRAMLYTVEALQLYTYFFPSKAKRRHTKNVEDVLWMRILIVIACTMDISGLLWGIQVIYNGLILHFGSTTFFGQPKMLQYIMISSCLAAVVSFIGQLFLTKRLFAQLPNRVLSIILVFLAFSSVVTRLVGVGINPHSPGTATRSPLNPGSLGYLFCTLYSLIAGALVNLILAFFLFKRWIRTKYHTGEDALDAFTNFGSLLFESGCVAAVLSIAVVGVYFIDTRGVIVPFLDALLSTIFCITMTIGLNDLRGNTLGDHKNSEELPMDGIRVSKHSVVRVEPGETASQVYTHKSLASKLSPHASNAHSTGKGGNKISSVMLSSDANSEGADDYDELR